MKKKTQRKKPFLENVSYVSCDERIQDGTRKAEWYLKKKNKYRSACTCKHTCIYMYLLLITEMTLKICKAHM